MNRCRPARVLPACLISSTILIHVGEWRGLPESEGANVRGLRWILALLCFAATVVVPVRPALAAYIQWSYPMSPYADGGFDFPGPVNYSDGRFWHLGQDVKGAAGASVYAAAEGVVKHTASRSLFGNVVILEHADGTCSLYGHLGPSGLPGIGSTVSRGSRIGYLGTTAQNGGWAPHLHWGVHVGAFGVANGSWPSWAAGRATASNPMPPGWKDPTQYVKDHSAAPDTAPPTGSITAPSAGSTLRSPGAVTISGAFNDNVKVAKVDFYWRYVDESSSQYRLIGTVSNPGATCSMAWNHNLQVGRGVVLKAIPADTSGNTNNSITVSVAVAANRVPVAGTVSPASGSLASGVWRDVIFTASDPDGVDDIRWVNLLIGPSTSYTANWASEVYLSYAPKQNTVTLWNETGGSAVGTAGTSAVLSNKVADIDLASSSATKTATGVTVTLRIRPHITGSKNVYLRVADEARYTTAYKTLGTVNLTSATPAVGTLTPNSGTLSRSAYQTLTFTATDADGAAQIRWARLNIGANADYSKFTDKIVVSATPEGKVSLFNKTGGTVAGQAGESKVLQTEAAYVDLAASSVAVNGNTMNVTLSIKPIYSGTNWAARICVVDQTFKSTGDVSKGTFTIN